MDSKYMSIIQYARDHNISDMTVRRRIKTGKLYAVLKDGKYFIPVDGKDSRQVEPKSEIKAPSYSGEIEVPTVRKEEVYTSQLRERKLDDAPSYRSRVSSAQAAPVEKDSLSRERLEKLDRILSGSSSSRSSLESKKLIELCEKVLAKIEKSEFFLEEKFYGKFDSLESELNILRSRFEASNKRVSRLERKIEDLKMLVDIMEEA